MAAQADTRSLAQFFFEVGYGAAWADGYIANGELAPFPMTDATVERAWAIAGEAYEDPQEFDAKLAKANASGALYDALEGLLFTVRARGVADLPVFDDDPALAEARAALALARGETLSDTGEKA